MFGLYLHIPFCMKKCAYCDFNSRPPVPGEVDAYLGALAEELGLFARGNRRLVQTVYVGGGTPSLLSEKQLSRLFDAVHETMTLLDDTEITVEANPGTLDRNKAGSLLSLGVNRVSVGVQSLHDRLLSRLGRAHTGEDALSALAMLRSAGFRNLCADLIYGIPGQSQKDWEEDLERLMELEPAHLSLYELSLEKGTPLEEESRRGIPDQPSEEEEIQMYKAAQSLTVRAGYEHYEISNYARPDYRSRHNTLYWTMEEYYGAGAGAHSFLSIDGPLRLSNVTDPADYIQRMKGGKDPVAKREFLKKKTFLGEAMMMGLRMTEGVKIQEFLQRYGVNPLTYFSETLDRAHRNQWVEISDDRIRLTGEGVLFSNEVFAGLF